MKRFWQASLCLLSLLFIVPSCKKTSESSTAGKLQLAWVKIGTTYLNPGTENPGLPADSSILISFNQKLDTNTVRAGVTLIQSDQSSVVCKITYPGDLSTVRLKPLQPLSHSAHYTLQINTGIKGASGEIFPGVEYFFTTAGGIMQLASISLNSRNFYGQPVLMNVDYKTINIQLRFSDELDSSNYKPAFSLSGNISLIIALSADHKTVNITNGKQLLDLTKYTFSVSPDLKSKTGSSFAGFSNYFFTRLDSTPKFPIISDEELLTLVQSQTFRYFYEFADPASGMARERNTSGEIVTTGGSGFGLMALVVGMHRNFITRDQGLTRLDKILTFLETCDRFHGAWPHWLNGNTGKVVPFSDKDNGGDLVETSYMAQGLLTIRQYMDSAVVNEKNLINRINFLLNGIEYDWYARGQYVLYWHWSPNYGWAMNMQIRGYNETLITYIMAATSTTHPVPAAVYHIGYARGGAIKNGNSYYGYKLPLGEPYGGPLFFTHYSFLGLDPRNLSDQYANYWEQNVNQSMINFSYCVADPLLYPGYSAHSWGLTASDNPWGYSAQSPTNDLGVITPTAAVSALPYIPEQSMNALKHFYYILGDKLWGEYGFYDAFDVEQGWWASSYLAIDEGPIICMIENYRSQLLWNLFTSSPEVGASLQKLGFSR